MKVQRYNFYNTNLQLFANYFYLCIVLCIYSIYGDQSTKENSRTSATRFGRYFRPCRTKWWTHQPYPIGDKSSHHGRSNPG